MTLTKILDKLNIGKSENEYDNGYGGAVFNDSNVTREKVGEYLKKCHGENNMPWELIDAILEGEVGGFYHYYADHVLPVCSDYDYIDIDDDGRVFVWCEVDGFHAYLDEYKRSWFTEKEHELLKPFIKEIESEK